MKFIISRNSIWDREISPHELAHKEKIISVDKRNTDCPSKLQGEDWYSRGKNHRVENGQICRDIEIEEWVIYIDSLEDLMEFRKRLNEDIIIGSYMFNENYLELTIMDMCMHFD